jgi:toxin HigB-1
MIRSFADRETKAFWETGKSRRLPPDIRDRAFAKLQRLHVAEDVQEMAFPPGNHLERLAGDLAGFWSVRINRQWRLIFRFHGQHAHDVAIVDYH